MLFLLSSTLGLYFSPGAHNLNSIKLSTINWTAQIRALLSLPENWGTNPVWDYWSGSTDTPYPGLFSISLLMELYLFPFVIHLLLLAVPIMHDSKRGTSYFKYRNIDGSNPTIIHIEFTQFFCK